MSPPSDRDPHPELFAAERHAAVPFAAVVEQLGQHGFALRRAWPRSLDHLHLDVQPLGAPSLDAQPLDARSLDSPDAAPIAGQWFADADRARETAAQTPGAAQAGHFVWQPAGADRKLRFLATLLAEPGTELVGHRPERRAVLRVRDGEVPLVHDGDDSTTYAKVVPRRRWASTVGATEQADLLALRTPALLGGDEKLGTIVTAALPGVPLHDLLASDRAQEACEATGEALAALHALPVPDDLPEHDLEAELAVTAHWEGLAAAFGVDSDSSLSGSTQTAAVFSTARPRAVLHRDFHDKQVLVDADGGVGVLDFDLMAVGDPALDLANLLGHLVLRATQGVVPDAAELREAVLRGYGPTPGVLSAAEFYEPLAHRRIAAVYAFRSTAYVT